MLQYIKQNKHVIMVAVTLFIVSMSTILFFFGSNGSALDSKSLKTDVLGATNVTESIDVKTPQDQENYYRKLVNNEEDSIFVINVDGTITFSSWDVENKLGFQQSELQNQVFYLLINPQDLSTFLNAFGKVIKTKQAIQNVGPYRLHDKSGNDHLNMASLTPILDQNNNVDSIAITTKDISSEVQNENQPNGASKTYTGKKIMNDKNQDNVRLMADKTN